MPRPSKPFVGPRVIRGHVTATGKLIRRDGTQLSLTPKILLMGTRVRAEYAGSTYRGVFVSKDEQIRLDIE